MKMRYVYLVAPDDAPVTKVGVANHVKRRLDGLQTGYPQRLHVRYEINLPADHAILMERELLHRFSAERMVGEWINAQWQMVVDVAKKIDIDLLIMRSAEQAKRREDAENARNITVLCTIRKRVGLTQQQLADRAGIHRQSVQAYESGTMPLVAQALKVARALGVEPGAIWPIDDERAA